MTYAKLKGRMREKDMTQAEMASLLGITPTGLYKKLKGEAPFKIDEAFKIFTALDLPETELRSYFFEG